MHRDHEEESKRAAGGGGGAEGAEPLGFGQLEGVFRDGLASPGPTTEEEEGRPRRHSGDGLLTWVDFPPMRAGYCRDAKVRGSSPQLASCRVPLAARCLLSASAAVACMLVHATLTAPVHRARAQCLALGGHLRPLLPLPEHADRRAQPRALLALSRHAGEWRVCQPATLAAPAAAPAAAPVGASRFPAGTSRDQHG